MKFFLIPFLKQEEDSFGVPKLELHKKSVFPSRTLSRSLMKINLVALLLGLGVVHVDANTYAQQVTLKRQKASLETILKDFEKQSGYTFFYKKKDVAFIKGVDVDVNRMPLNQALNLVLKSDNLTFEYFDKTIVIKKDNELKTKQLTRDVQVNTVLSLESTLQQMLRGQVLNPSGQPIVGVNVQVKGTKSGVVTESNGRFSINIADDQSVLVFSYIGYETKEISILGKSQINVTLNLVDSDLEEVLVVGYGLQKRISLTGSVAQIDSKDIMQAPMPNLSHVLGGRLPGLVSRQESGQPGMDNATLLVRGVNTWVDSSPIILVDGVERPFTNLDPNEVASVSILKDAAAAVIYGVKGANGVILVTTKRGMSMKPELSFTTSWTSSQNTRFPKLLDGEEFAYWYNYAEVINDRDPLFTKDDVNKIVHGDSDGYFGNTDWYDRLFKKSALMQMHNISMNGGGQQSRYFFSFGTLMQDGTVKNVGFDRYNLRGNIDVDIRPDLTLSTELSGRVESRDGLGVGNFTGTSNLSSLNIMTMMMAAHPYINAYDKEGIPLVSSLSTKNPLAARDLSGSSRMKESVFNGGLHLKYTPTFLDGLSVKLSSHYDIYYNHNKHFFQPFNVRIFDPRSKAVTENIGAGLGTEMQLTEGFDNTSRITFQEQINYNNTFGKHQVSALFVAEQSRWKNHFVGVNMRDFDFKELPDFNFGKSFVDRPSGYTQELPRVGFATRLNYDYDNRYLVQIAGRADASTVFSKDNRWGYFPALSVGWRVSEESFFKRWTSDFDEFKLRASAGILGNDRIDEFQYLRMMGLNSGATVVGGKLVNGLYTLNVPNEDITWEKSYNYNLGVDFSMWQQRLTLGMDIFYKITEDILTGVSSLYPPSVGGNFPAVVNMGKVDNRGFEVSVGHKNKIKSINYSVQANVGYSKNRILKIDESENIPDYQRQIGNPIGMKYGYIYDGLFSSDEEARLSPTWGGAARAGDIRYVDYNGDGRISYDQDRVVIGRSNIPELMFGLNASIDWKGIGLSAFFQGAARSNIALMGVYPGVGWDDTEYTRPFYNGANTPRYLVERAWTPTNQTATYPRLDTQFRNNNNAASSLWIEDGTYLRLKTLQLAYTLPTGSLPFLKREARFYLAGSNLFTLSHMKYLDPESPDVNNGYYPQQRTFSFGFNFTL